MPRLRDAARSKQAIGFFDRRLHFFGGPVQRYQRGSAGDAQDIAGTDDLAANGRIDLHRALVNP